MLLPKIYGPIAIHKQQPIEARNPARRCDVTLVYKPRPLPIELHGTLEPEIDAACVIVQ